MSFVSVELELIELYYNHLWFVELQIDKDPDIRLDKLFVVGQVMPVQVS